MKPSLLTLTLTVLAATCLLQAQDGKAVYDKYCSQCHGDEGDGQGYATAFVQPKPRDFTTGVFKFRSTGNEYLPTDEDLTRVVRLGIPGTSMPAFGHIGEPAIKEVVTYIKTFFSDRIERDKEDGYYPPKTITIGKAPTVDADMIAAGREIYIANGCADCHGKEGRADGPSSPTLVDDYNVRIKAANLTTKWHFRGGSSLVDIYRAFSTGLAGTPMPSYQDSLTDEQRWQLAAFVYSLSPDEKPEAASQVVAAKVSELPADGDDPAWAGAEEAWFPLSGQVIWEPINTDPTIQAVRVKALHDGTNLALRVSWDDPSFSLEGMEAAAEATSDDEDDFWGDEPEETDTASEDDFWGDEDDGGDEGAVEEPVQIVDDRFAIQFPSGEAKSNEKPYFVMGNGKSGVNLWRWTNSKDLSETQAPEGEDPNWARYHVGYSGAAQLESILAKGPGSLTPFEADTGLTGKVTYENGTYTLVVTRPLISSEAMEVQVVEGSFIPIAFWAWDGARGEQDLKGALSAWYYLVLEQPIASNAWFKIAAAVVITLVLQWLAVIFARRRTMDRDPSAAPVLTEGVAE